MLDVLIQRYRDKALFFWLKECVPSKFGALSLLFRHPTYFA